MKRTWAALTDVNVESGTAMDSSTQYRGFVTVRATAADGSWMAGQLSPVEVRAMALQFLEAAEAADQDAIVFTMLTRDVGLPPEEAAGFVMLMRKERA